MQDEPRMIKGGPLSFVRISRFDQFEPGDWEVVSDPHPGMPPVYVVRDPRQPMLLYSVEWVGEQKLPRTFTIEKDGTLATEEEFCAMVPALNGC